MRYGRHEGSADTGEFDTGSALCLSASKSSSGLWQALKSRLYPPTRCPTHPKSYLTLGDLELTAARDAAGSSFPPPHKEQLSLCRSSSGAAHHSPP